MESVSDLFFERLGCNLNDISFDMSTNSLVRVNTTSIKENANHNNKHHEKYAAFQIKLIKRVDVETPINNYII